MSDIELVIKIPNHLYKLLKEFPSDSNEGNIENVLMKAVEHGTPLPKGHGRLLDEKDILDTENNDGGWYDLVDMPEYIAGVKAIIPADKQTEDT